MKPSYFKFLSIFIICYVGIIVYSGTFSYAFNFDDIRSIVNNNAIRNIRNLRVIWDFSPCRFITYLSFALNYHIHQLDVTGYRLFNLAVHLSLAVLVYWFSLLTFSTPVMREQKITQHAKLISFFTGLLFVAHPIQTEAVTYIQQRAASLATFFYLFSLCLYVKSRLIQLQEGEKVIIRFLYGFALAMAVIAMFTKEMTVTLPLMICLYEFSFFRESKNLNRKYRLFFLSTIFIIPLTLIWTKAANYFDEVHCPVQYTPPISPWHYLLTQFRVIVTYIRLVFLPLGQNLDYDYPVARSLLSLPVLASLFLLVFILILAIRLFRNYRLLSFGILWFFLTLSVESGILSMQDVIFEHRLYLPMVGCSLFLASGLYYLFKEKRIKFTVFILCLLVISYSALAYQRNKIWQDGFSLWSDVVRKSPFKAKAYLGRGLAYQFKGKFDQAFSDYNKAIAIDPHCIKAYINRGNIYQGKSQFDLAILDYSRAINIDPCYPEAYNNRGITYVIQGNNFERAIADYTKAIALNPNYAEAYNNRGVAYSMDGRFDQAILDYTQAIALNPDYANAYKNRAGTYYEKKEYAKTWLDVRKAESLGSKFDAEFMQKFKKVSGEKSS